MSVLLQIDNLSKAYDIKPLFNKMSLSVSSNQHIGVVGRNGAGKSTIFKIILGLETADSGSVRIHDGTRLGYIQQQDNPFNPSETVIDFLMRSSGKEEWECAKMAGQFQIKGEDLKKIIDSFAGGYQMRIKIIAMLLDDPNLLLLDEPTNYLDLTTLLLLEQFLQSFSGSFLLISHDREFLKRTCKSTLEIANEKAVFYPQPLEEYLEYKAQQEEFTRRYNKKIEKQQRHLQTFVDRFGSKASKASQAQSKIKQINRLEKITSINPVKTAAIYISPVENKKGIALSVHDMSIGYDDKLVVENINFEINRGEHVAIVGNNGQGKSTLLKTITGDIPTLAGSFRFAKNIRIGYYAQHVIEMLDPKDQVETHLKNIAGSSVGDQEIFQMAGNFLFRDDSLKKSISVLSGGEKARLCLAGLLLQKNDFLLLDEPSNHLDFETVEALATGLSDSNTTLLFVSHNRTFVKKIATSIIEVENGKAYRSLHDYENYVYHLKKQNEIEDIIEEDLTKNVQKEQRLEVYAELKQEKKKLHNLEIIIMELEKQKQKLERWFEKNPSTYSPTKQKGIDETNQKLQEIEQEWFLLQESIANLETKRQDLQ